MHALKQIPLAFYESFTRQFPVTAPSPTVADAVPVHEHRHRVAVGGVPRAPGAEPPEAVPGAPGAAERAVLPADQADLATPHPAQNRRPGKAAQFTSSEMTGPGDGRAPVFLKERSLCV